MGQYGRAACIAADLVAKREVLSPREAWKVAMSRVSNSDQSRTKPCPRSTFLSLCETGMVKGVPIGTYTSAPDNKPYALEALTALKSDPDLARNQSALWEVATHGSGKAQNGQIDVLVTLWREGRLLQESGGAA